VERAILETINGAIDAGATFGDNGVLDFNDINNGLVGFADPSDPTVLYPIIRVVKTDDGYYAKTDAGDFSITDR
jgi:hypothetical protein